MCINVEGDDGRFFTGWISSHGPKRYCNLRCSFRHKTHIIKMHFNSPLWCLELFSTPKGYSVKYTNRQLPPPSRSRQLGASEWRHPCQVGTVQPVSGGPSPPPEGPICPWIVPSLGRGDVGGKPGTSLVQCQPHAEGTAEPAWLPCRAGSAACPAQVPLQNQTPGYRTIQPGWGLWILPSLGSSWNCKSCSAYFFPTTHAFQHT